MRRTLLLIVGFVLFTTVSIVAINTAVNKVPKALGYCTWCECVVYPACCEAIIRPTLDEAQDNIQWTRSRMAWRPWQPESGGSGSSGSNNQMSQLTSRSLKMFFPHISGQMATSIANLNETLKYMDSLYENEILPALSRGDKFVKRPPDFNMAPLKPFYKETLQDGIAAQRPAVGEVTARKAYGFAKKMYRKRATKTVARFHDLKKFESMVIPMTKDMSIKEGMQLLSLVQAYNQMLARERSTAKSRLLEIRSRALSYPDSVRESQPVPADKQGDGGQGNQKSTEDESSLWDLLGFE